MKSTPDPNHPAARDIPPELHRQLRDFRRHLWRAKLMEAFLAGVFGLLFSFLLVFLLDRLFSTPGWLRLALLLVGTSFFALFAPYWVNRWIFKNRRENQLARLISRKFPRLGDRLLGVLELSSQNESSATFSPALRAAATRDVAAAAAKRDFAEALPQNRNRLGLVTVAVLALLAAGAFLFVPKAGYNALQRWLMPLSDTPRYTLTQFGDGLPARLVVPLGEPFALEVPLHEDSENQPAKARARLGAQGWRDSAREDDHYHFDFPGQQEAGEITLAAGDARARVRVIPTLPPTLESVGGTLTFPAYLQRPDRQIEIRSGTLSLLHGSSLSLQTQASRPLSAGTLTVRDLPLDTDREGDSETLAARIEGARASHPALAMADVPREVRLAWVDDLGLAGTESFRLRLEPHQDERATVYLQGAQRQLAILPEETVEFEVTAQDDYGLKSFGLEWQGEFTKPSPDEPAQGELELASGGPTETQLVSPAAFSPLVYDIAPQKLTLRAYCEDYHPEHGRSYSQTIEIYILTRDEHAQMLKDRFDRAIGELEDAAREEQNNLDENKRLERLADEELQTPENQERLEKQRAAEQANIEKMEELNETVEELFADALRNGEIDKETLQKLAETRKQLGELSQEDLPQVEELLRQAQDQRSTPEQAKKDLAEAIQKQEEALQKMRETLEKANEAKRDFEAATFVNRLKRAASEHDGIASALADSLDRLVGLDPREIDPVEERLLGELGMQQKRTASDVRWIQEDLGHFFARTEEAIHQELLTEMQESRIDEALERNRERLTSNLTFRGIVFSKEWARQLREWAEKLEGSQNQNGGGGGEGGGGGGSMEDQDFEFMLKVMRMIQSEQDIRARTRAVEQLRRTGLPPTPRLP
ncbi:hypothetical protein [Roseibacillus ishigakijimensis]|uniref:Uncharacterized protein n=1 Tax=Roseibacillus ishigakijimensis TaxID=454146 RepID=A0A934RQF1_9BACT|nr:hypothetical protein [Roseibacillus ishigakijimensis]MBK1835075.1 hypothetical protein [Roseibacillus ishigakijimensis]